MVDCQGCGKSDMLYGYAVCNKCDRVFCSKCMKGNPNFCPECTDELREFRQKILEGEHCRGCGGVVVESVCTQCGPHDSPRLTNRRRSATTKKTAPRKR